ncbi:hypothetical protein EYC98_12155 [Halieaceae bacterium IMCC14734]|uniref:Cytochrome c domain-containing protein n=1 Tax=Candidatus Litorirhabdus singularis TaxID=2518993 RepID=A0ABT3TIP4_9GAMM|nr:hypothetical protein [Candidatus Litorirhabdus singularis]MCX2981616.1 hypothetical protein [Candidatus Litorirhabdus singularis]
MKIIVPLLSLLLLSACGQPAVPPPVAKFQPVTDIHETMLWILDPAADKIWDSAGTIITAEGRTELAPTTDEGWQEVVQAAAVLAEAGNLLMLPGRSAGADWNEYSEGLIGAGQLAIAAAQQQDSDALFDAGGRIYLVCKACHDQYWIEGKGAPE